MSRSRFKYKPLSGERSIRLAHLTKNDKARHGFRIQLSETHLDENLVFQALSYTWGLPYHVDITDLERPNLASGETFTVECDDGEEVTITENLYYALKQLTSSAGGEAIMPIWIDALCINQDDDAEKSSQVNMMSDIYSTATRVVVWLGKDDPPPRFLQAHSNQGLEEYLTDVSMGILEAIPTAEALQSMGMSSLQDWQDMWWDYVCFYRRQRYFRRVWIIQETALARDITVLCGSHTLDWARLVVIGNLLHRSNVSRQWILIGPRTELLTQKEGWTPGDEIRRLHTYRTDHRLNGGLPMHLHQTTANFMRGRQDREADDGATQALLKGLGALGDRRHKEYAYFSWVLKQFSDYQATDKRDYVFAALGFCGPFFRAAGMDLPIAVDYNKTVQEVFTDVTAKLLSSLPVLSLLSFVDDEKRRIQDLPSWVPDFTAPFSKRSMIWRGFAISSRTDAPESDDDEFTLDPIYNASKVEWPRRMDEEPLVSVEGRRLRVSGTRLGTVQAVCPASFRTAAEFNYLPYLEFAYTAMPSTYRPTGECREEALWRTLFGNFCDSMAEYPAPAAVGSELFRQHVLETLAVAGMSKINNTPDAGIGVMLANATAELIRVSALLARLADDGAGFAYLPTPVEVGLQFNAYMAKVLDAVGATAAPADAAAARAPAYLEALSTSLAAEFGVSEAEVECMTMLGLGMGLPQRRLYTTAEGALGVGPAGTRPGDEVWVIKGAKVPFVLRRREGGSEEFALQGDTYLHGAMDGKMLDAEAGAGAMGIVLC